MTLRSGNRVCTIGRPISIGLPAGMAVALLALAGCQKAETKAAGPKPPEVIVAQPTEQEFREFEEFTGRTTAIETVELRSRVSGYLDKVLFQDGAEVAVDELLCVVDPR